MAQSNTPQSFDPVDTTADMDMSDSPVASANVVLTMNSADIWPPPPPAPTNVGFPLIADPSLLMVLGHYPFTFAPQHSTNEPTSVLLLPSQTLTSSSALNVLVQHEIIRLSNAVLYPPNPTAPTPPLRTRPPGCRTIFVGGLAEKCTEEMLRELFERCGEIQSVRTSKKNFAHIRFVSPEAVDKALLYSGYRLRVEDRTEKEYSGRLHVDYAQARDDQHEWEMQQRLALKQRRRDNSSSPTSPPALHFSEHEMSTLLEKLKSADGFDAASSTLSTWLYKGNCNKKTSTQFYSLIAAVNAHVRRLLQEKQQFDTEMATFKERHIQRLQNIRTQFGQIEKVFHEARKQKNWDHFSKGQRKNLDVWLKQAEVLRKAHEFQMLKSREEEEMETSDDDDDQRKSPKRQRLNSNEHIQMSERYDRQEVDQTELENKLNEALKIIADQKIKISKLEGLLDASVSTSTGDNITVDKKEAELIALLSNFLHVHPFGASVDYLWSYLREMIVSIRSSDIENVLEKYPQIFLRKECGVGASYERKWLFIGFNRHLQ